MNKAKYLMGLLIYKIAPIRKNRYVFTSFDGHYSDNTKAISIKLHEVKPDTEIIWLVKPEFEAGVPTYAKTVHIDTLKAFWYRGTATAQIDNVYGFRTHFKMTANVIAEIKRKLVCFLSAKRKQPIFATTHGTTFKKCGRDQIGNTVFDVSSLNTCLLVGDALTAEILKWRMFNKMPVSVTGWPRNDVLFAQNPCARDVLNIPNGKKVLLYAPTFRNDGKDVEGKNIYRSGLNQLAEMDFDRLFETLNRKFGGDWVMVCRFHYHVANMVQWDVLNAKYPGKFINGNLHDDMADYLSCTDVLITDSSSSMFDFALTKKPCFLYFPDLEHYRDKERGFYMDIETLPFPTAIEFSELIKNIETFEVEKYHAGVDALLTRIGAVADDRASERSVEYILQTVNAN